MCDKIDIVAGLTKPSVTPRPWVQNSFSPVCIARLYTESVKIALGQINPTVGDFTGNASKIIDFAERAKSAGAGLIMFPE
jgi:hypothetical protein